VRVTTMSSSRKTREPVPSSCRPLRSSSPLIAVSRPASCARSRQYPSPCVAPPIYHKVSICTPSHERTHAPRNNILVLPANLVAQPADGAVLATGLQSQDTQSLGDDHLLLLVVRGRDSLEDLQSLKSSSSTGGLVRDHAADSLVEDSGRGAEMEGACRKSASSDRASRGGMVRGHGTYHRG
jgi:hypothetical protein